MYIYKPKGVCSKEIHLSIDNDIIQSVEFLGGCPGNILGIARLIEGMNAKEALIKLKGITCGAKNTSCPDQLALALEQYYSQK